MKKYSLSDWANFSEIIGAIAVVISLIYVGNQVYENTAAIKSATARESLAGFREQQLMLSENPELLDLILRRDRNEDLSELELARLDNFVHQYLALLEQAYWEHKRGLLEDEMWAAWNNMFKEFMQRPYFGSVATLETLETYYSAPFFQFVHAEVFSGEGSP